MIYTTSLTGSILLFVVRIIQIYNILILARVFASWIIRNPYNRLYHFLLTITEPLLGQIRRILPPMMGLDFSPIIAFFILNLLTKLISSLI
ncbi:MAG: YggT family protein [Candidatus Cloacimonetes bacterium]|nr:YggT family protein [Candidatus Cloacimonadota bacterium]MDD4676839.1 YggT family protein [Candidatus Cloacimonadota bacterium]